MDTAFCSEVMGALFMLAGAVTTAMVLVVVMDVVDAETGKVVLGGFVNELGAMLDTSERLLGWLCCVGNGLGDDLLQR